MARGQGWEGDLLSVYLSILYPVNVPDNIKGLKRYLGFMRKILNML